MDRDQFDRLSRLIGAAGSRRDALRTLVAAAVAAAVVSASIGNEHLAAARKRQKQRNRKVSGQQTPVACLVLPTTCSQNCDSKPLRGGANLSKCNFSGRDLDGVKLNGANLSKTCFSETSLRYADLRSTNLGEACLCGADLTGADFRGSNVSAAQLSCATVACNTVLPNGKPAKPCGAGKTCCFGECVDTRTDRANCGACGSQCTTCQTCTAGRCENLPANTVDCNGNPLEDLGGGTVCTVEPQTGICDLGQCNCGPGGMYDQNANICRCSEVPKEECRDDEGKCCRVTGICLDSGEYQTDFTCFRCVPVDPPGLCCEYLCPSTGPGPRPKKHVCLADAVPGVTHCAASFEGCSFNTGTFVDFCADCGG